MKIKDCLMYIAKVTLFFNVLFWASGTQADELKELPAADVQKEVTAAAGLLGVTLTRAELAMIMSRLERLEKDLQYRNVPNYEKLGEQQSSSAVKYIVTTIGVVAFFVLLYFLAEKFGLIDYVRDRVRTERARGIGRDVRDAFRDIHRSLQ